MNKKIKKMREDIDKLLTKIMEFERDHLAPKKETQDRVRKNCMDILDIKNELYLIRPMLEAIWGCPLFEPYRSKGKT